MPPTLPASFVQRSIAPSAQRHLRRLPRKLTRLRVAYVSPAPDDTELAKTNDIAVELLSRISPAIVTPDIVSRHWQESAPPVIRQTRIQKVKRKQAKTDAMANKSQLDAVPKACQLEEFDAVRWAFSLRTGCHT